MEIKNTVALLDDATESARPIGRVLAREITVEEIMAVSGGTTRIDTGMIEQDADGSTLHDYQN